MSLLCAMVGGDDGGPTLGEWTWHHAGCIAAAVPGCHCWVPLVDQTFGVTLFSALIT